MSKKNDLTDEDYRKVPQEEDYEEYEDDFDSYEDEELEEEAEADEKNGGGRPKRKKGKGWKIALITLAVIVLLLVVGIYVVFHHFYKLMKYDDGSTLATTEFTEETDPSLTNSSPEEIADADLLLRRNLEDNSIPLMFSDDVYNILLIGDDTRDINTLGRSDSMILISINKKDETIVMTSFMRDSYVTIPDHGNTRLNAAYAYGGADLLIDTIEQNFKIKIDRYVAVNFETFTDVIETLGGVDIELTDEEAKYLKVYEGTSDGDAAGTYHLDGATALSYSRIRYIGNNDYRRTERQRTVLNAVLKQTKKLKLTQLNDLLNLILPEVRTNLKEGELFSLMLDYVSDYRKYEVKQCRVPYDGTITDLVINGAMVLGIDMEANQEYLRENIYGE